MVKEPVVLALADKTSDAYSYDRVRSWKALVRALLRAGYTEREAEAILRSKYVRWGCDRISGSRLTPIAALVRWLRGEIDRADLDGLVEETFPDHDEAYGESYDDLREEGAT